MVLYIYLYINLYILRFYMYIIAQQDILVCHQRVIIYMIQLLSLIRPHVGGWCCRNVQQKGQTVSLVATLHWCWLIKMMNYISLKKKQWQDRTVWVWTVLEVWWKPWKYWMFRCNGNFCTTSHNFRNFVHSKSKHCYSAIKWLAPR